MGTRMLVSFDVLVLFLTSQQKPNWIITQKAGKWVFLSRQLPSPDHLHQREVLIY